MLPNEERWDCHQCGICCRGSLVPLSSADLDRLKNQKWEEHPDFQGQPVVIPHGSAGGFRLAQRADATCVFLNDQGLCRIHAELGFEAKPTICRVFPLQLIPQDKQMVLTLRRACPSSALDRGQPLAGHLPMMREFVAEGRLDAEAIPPPRFKSRELREWKTVRLFLAALARLLQDERYPPVRRIVHALQMASLVETAKTKSLAHAQIAELLQAMEAVVAEESREFFENRRPPSWFAGIFFRQIAAEYLRLHPAYRAQKTWSQRWQLTTTAFRMARGSGSLPKLHPEFPGVTFAELEEPLGKIDPQVYVPLARLIETSAASFLYALAHRGGWSVVESLRSLALLFPVGLWLLRWASHGREPTVEDMVNIVVALDRGQGFQNLNTALQRWRLNTLGSQQELERLVVWYAR